MRIGAAIMVFGMALSVHLNGQLTDDRPIKCGWGAHPELLRARIAAPQVRPDRQVMYISASGAFAVHYDTTGQHSPVLDSSQPDGTPDWVVEVATALDSARNLLLVLGFDPAPADDDSVYDVYIINYDLEPEQYYGVTQSETDLGGNRYTSYIKMDNDFSPEEGYPTCGLDAARVTAAHEYFHAVQLGYIWRESDRYFYELSSVWFEDVAYPEVNDWVNYFNDFGNNPTQNMARTDGYSIAIFGHYLTHITGDYQPDIMQQTWQRFKSASATAAIEYGLTSYSSNLTVAWTDFVAKLFLNGRAPPELYFYPDQDRLTPPDVGVPQPLTGAQSQVFEGLKPGAAGIQALDLAGPTNLCLQVGTAPSVYAARLVLNTDRLAFSSITRNPWYITGLTSLSQPILVVGGESGDVEIMATAIDTLVPLDYALDFLAPNPVYPYGRLAHTGLTLGYRVAKALPRADHRIVIYNILGQEIFRTQIIRLAGEGSHTLSFPIPAIQQWPSGVYILRLTVDQRHTFTRTFTLLR